MEGKVLRTTAAKNGKFTIFLLINIGKDYARKKYEV